MHEMQHTPVQPRHVQLNIHGPTCDLPVTAASQLDHEQTDDCRSRRVSHTHPRRRHTSRPRLPHAHACGRRASASRVTASAGPALRTHPVPHADTPAAVMHRAGTEVRWSVEFHSPLAAPGSRIESAGAYPPLRCEGGAVALYLPCPSARIPAAACLGSVMAECQPARGSVWVRDSCIWRSGTRSMIQMTRRRPKSSECPRS